MVGEGFRCFFVHCIVYSVHKLFKNLSSAGAGVPVCAAMNVIPAAGEEKQTYET